MQFYLRKKNRKKNPTNERSTCSQKSIWSQKMTSPADVNPEKNIMDIKSRYDCNVKCTNYVNTLISWSVYKSKKILNFKIEGCGEHRYFSIFTLSLGENGGYTWSGEKGEHTWEKRYFTSTQSLVINYTNSVCKCSFNSRQIAPRGSQWYPP